MIEHEPDEQARRAAVQVMAHGLGLVVPDAAVSGVVSNLGILARHHAVVRAALDKEPQA